jgi:alpha-L-rhamnosidase
MTDAGDTGVFSRTRWKEEEMFQTWITNQTAKPFYARRTFELTKPVKRVAANVCGLGQFAFYVNGKKAGDHELDPAWTDYRKLIYYLTYDVKDLLREGENVIGAEVGNGWYHKCDEHYTFSFPDFMPPNPNPYRPFGSCLILALELMLEYEDGTADRITADERFRVKEHSVVMSNVYGSETIDGRLVQKGWCAAGFDDSAWQQASRVPEEEIPAAELREQTMPPVKVTASYPGRLSGVRNGREIYDFGQNMSGILEFEAKGKTGDEIRVYPAEKLGADGDVDQIAKNWTTVDSRITYLIGHDNVWERCRMTFTYFAGRYVGVELPEHAAVRALTAHAITSAHRTDGSFTCDDERYNQVYAMIERTVEANMVGVHTDCPTIERFAWQEPNHLMACSIFYMKDGRLLWEKFLRDMRAAQHTKDDYFYDFEGEKFYPGDGLMPSQCPCYIPNVLPVPGMGSFYDIIPWGSTCILGAYWHYRFYGDRGIIEDNYGAGLRYFRYLLTKVNRTGFLCHGLGDWGNPKNELARENVETAFLYADAVCLAEFAGILNRGAEREELLRQAEEIRDRYNAKLLIRHPKNGFWCYGLWNAGRGEADGSTLTQAAQALPLFWGMVPEEKKEDVIRALRETIDAEGALIAGEVGLPYIIQCARKYGMNEQISRFVLRETHPGYYAFILDGETTLGEYWETNPRSHCHDMLGYIIEWYYNGIAGILPEEPGFARVTIRPWLPKSIHEFTCTYRSVRGQIRVHVKETADEIRLKTEIPADTEYTIDDAGLRERGKKICLV